MKKQKIMSSALALSMLGTMCTTGVWAEENSAVIKTGNSVLDDVVITFMSYFLEKDREKIEEEILKLLDGIYYVGDTALEKEQLKYLNFSAGKVSSYKAGDLLEYDMPECFQYDEQRTAALQYQYDIFHPGSYTVQ